MKVLHVMPSLARTFGGPTQSWVGYAQAARTQGIEVDVVAPAVSDADASWLKSNVPDATYRYFKGGGKGALTFAPGLQRWITRNGRRYDAIHVHGLFNPISSFALRICVRKKWPVVLRPFGTLSKYTVQHRRSWLKRKYFDYLDGPSLQRTRGLHFTTPAEREEAAWHGIDFSNRSYVVPPPLQGLTIPTLQTETGQAGPTVLFLARLHPVKNIECVLDAWPWVHRVLPDARLVIAGSGEADYVDGLKNRADNLSGKHQIEFAGFVEGKQKAQMLASSSVFVLPSFQENFGVAVMEAVSYGLPVVISRHVKLASFIEEQELGHVIEPTPEELAFSIVQILQDRSFQQHCSQHGPASVQQSFSLRTVGKQLVSMYQSVVDQHIN